ncbi:MAG TPA: class I SAM-dependent methyltransferase, partial [Planctomycetaceae bacterium]
DRGHMTAPGIPRRLLRHLVRIGKISIDSKVLDAGCGRGELTRFFDELAIDVSGIDESPERITAAKSAAAHLDYSCSRPSMAMPFPEQSFDVVLARELPEHRVDLFSHEALRATAHLLAMLRPLGCLIMLSRLEPGWSNQPGGHLATCFQQHLECFPGVRQVSYLVDSFVDKTTWKWMLGRQPRAGFITAALTISQTRRSCREWEQIADEAASSRRQICCAWSQQTVRQNAESPRPSKTAA